jgi:hypothetical protein
LSAAILPLWSGVWMRRRCNFSSPIPQAAHIAIAQSRQMPHFHARPKKSSHLRHFPVAFEKCLGHIAPVAARRDDTHGPQTTPGLGLMSGCSSGVEHNLAKVGVEGSNPFARSSFLNKNQSVSALSFWRAVYGSSHVATTANFLLSPRSCKLTNRSIAARVTRMRRL